jgi:hypothetical protein
MTNETYNYKQLLELAVLDAYGLLEPIEEDLFNRSFHNATASIQEEIKRIQEDIALDDSLLPSDMPSPSLRKKVLHAVAETADSEAQRLAPLALIGARASAAQANFGSSRAVTLWRTAAVVLFGVTVVLAIITLDVQRKANQNAQIALNSATNMELNELVGHKFSEFVGNPYCQVTRLEREDGNANGYLRIALNERFGNGFVIGIDLEKDEEIIIQGTTSTGEVIELARITADGPIVGRDFAVDKSIIKNMTIAAVDAKTGKRWV